MTIYFTGSLKKLQKYVKKTNPEGAWRELKQHCHQYKSADGGVLNWWEGRKTLLFQGEPSASKEFKREFLKLASRKNLIQNQRPPKCKVLSVADRVSQLEKEVKRLKKVVKQLAKAAAQ